ncbi:MAG: TetR/AcrR family transcriptional regulator [Bacteroidetes bacterium]|nr:TetR/AcrR family transcriptional regulator [Bacteroidota bacterium]
MAEKKGVKSRQWIVEQSVHVFNTYGLDITLNQLANHLNISRGRISHFFATRDSIFVAMGEAYQAKLADIRSEFVAEHPNFTFPDLFELFGKVMDNQYVYRCTVMYSASSGNSRDGIIQHINETYRRSKLFIRALAEKLVSNQSLKQEILDESNYPVFEFQFINLFTSWVISKEIYYPEQPYLEMKPLFLEGLFRLFEPYLLDKSSK